MLVAEWLPSPLQWAYLVLALALSYYVLSPSRSRLPPGDAPVRGHDLCWFLLDDQIPFIINAFQTMDRISLDEARSLVQARMVEKQDRLKHRIVYHHGRPCWSPDANFKLEDHVYADVNANVHNEAELKAYVSQHYTRDLDRSKPLWEMILIEDYTPSESVLVMRFHHVVGDGISLVSMMFSAVDKVPTPTAAPVKVGQTASSLSLLKNGGNNIAAAIGQLRPRDVSPYRPPRVSGKMRAAWSGKVSLADLKFVKNTFECSINDVVVACVTAGLRAYLEKTGGLKATARVRASLPVNLRGPSPSANRHLQNYFGIVYFQFPVHEADRLTRLHLVKARAASMKASIEPHLTLLGLSVIANLPLWLARPLLHVMSSKATLVFSNVPGLQEPCSFGGKRLHDVHFFAPGGFLPINISVLSYAHGVDCNVGADESVCDDPQYIADMFVSEFEALHALAKARAST
ncbi:hypothetical protein SPRG_00540 [Saprolegnia parasitica CBS 223.65]|uniref:Uncharacterized protein n=1 Tax=Saprolegnia parasitica (strain CBS 223.65) TaxID=695850 RepID=A0A067D710_SAPPC|nr:hypothetical protein SPRG_00540 [Saprolegnia parasitica CBS 223.65]KDO34476.1 hypothetical protein SPRG_00540 [Saprolegnia parasitica CBS 223.65]|eukprot:XP_012194157.1 hypothetical protein SPRG_00540 [Saprolegnia parasitica CBS 223.65]